MGRTVVKAEEEMTSVCLGKEKINNKAPALFCFHISINRPRDARNR